MLKRESRRFSRCQDEFAAAPVRWSDHFGVDCAGRAGAFQHLLLRYVFALVTQASQIGVCNHDHAIEQRLCRFLSIGFDRTSANEMAFTHDRIAVLLDVRRESITQAASQLQSAGIIEYQRGHIRLISRKMLEERSCACGGIIRRAFQAVLE
jgi:CRP-like cAMP-binding protein